MVFICSSFYYMLVVNSKLFYFLIRLQPPNSYWVCINITIIKYMSSDEYEAPPDNQDKGKANENGVREFGCPCGKTYLSYPALYTHVKTKHNGNAPGTLIKPKNQKTRGRPRTIIVDTPLDDSECPFDLKEQIQKILSNVNLSYQQNFETSEGDTTCQDMASKFLQQLKTLQPAQLKAIKCFLNELKHFIVKKCGEQYWKEHEPNQIIEMANEFYHNHESNKQKYPLDKNILIDLTFLLFKWMYRNKWTNHKLLKRSCQLAVQAVK